MRCVAALKLPHDFIQLLKMRFGRHWDGLLVDLPAPQRPKALSTDVQAFALTRNN
jgi:hypothetical protein